MEIMEIMDKYIDDNDVHHSFRFFFNHDFRSACSTHLGVSASYFKECVHYKFRNVSGMCGAVFFLQGGARVKIRRAGQR